MSFDLAQCNVARLRAPLHDPSIAEFVAGLSRINRLAAHSPGFIWRLDGGHEDLPVLDEGDARMVVNLSTWSSYQDLHQFTYRSAHGAYVRRRSRWFMPLPGPSTVLWWVASGHRPTTDEGLSRLERLRTAGAGPRAFTVRRRFDPNGRATRSAAPGAAHP